MNNQPPPPSQHSRPNPDAYRAGVGIVLFSSEGLVLVAERIDNPGNWQMPQGGIDEGEAVETAVFREMEEEIGTRDAEIIGMMGDWIYYDFPEHRVHNLFEGKYLGQRQKWVALQFLGSDADINLAGHFHPEFSSWKWIPLGDLLRYAAPFKRSVYTLVMEEFAKFST